MRCFRIFTFLLRRMGSDVADSQTRRIKLKICSALKQRKHEYNISSVDLGLLRCRTRQISINLVNLKFAFSVGGACKNLRFYIGIIPVIFNLSPENPIAAQFDLMSSQRRMFQG